MTMARVAETKTEIEMAEQRLADFCFQVSDFINSAQRADQPAEVYRDLQDLDCMP